MKTWYLTREGSGDIIHRGKIIPPGHKIYLSEQQAKLHQAKIVKTEPPDSPQGAIILEEYFEHLEFAKKRTLLGRVAHEGNQRQLGATGNPSSGLASQDRARPQPTKTETSITDDSIE